MHGPCPLAYTHQLSSHTVAEPDPRPMKGHVLWAHGASPIPTLVPCSSLPVSSLTTAVSVWSSKVPAVPHSSPAVHIHSCSPAQVWVSQAGRKLTIWLRMTPTLLVFLPRLAEGWNTGMGHCAQTVQFWGSSLALCAR